MSQTRLESKHGSTTSTPFGTPRWVKIFGIIVIALALLAGIVMFTGGEHGPGRHIPATIVTETGNTSGHMPQEAHGTPQP
jgi:hypothetical protein